MEFIAIITALALVEYMAFSMRVGMARGKYNVPAPATTGNEDFERVNRVHQNTLEQLIVFVPSLWIFAEFTSMKIAAGLGVLFLVGRLVYAVAYVADPKKRTVGFLMGFVANVLLVLGGVFGAVKALL